MTIKVCKEKGEEEARWWCWRGIEVNKNISNNLTKKSILSSQPILQSVVMLPFSCPNLSQQSHSKQLYSVIKSTLRLSHQKHNIKPINVMKLTENRSPTTKTVNKFISGVKDFKVGPQPYSSVGHKRKQPYQSAVRNSTAVCVLSDADSLLNVSDADAD